MVEQISVSKSSVTPNLRSYRSATANRSFGMPLLVEYRWLRGLRTASISFSTAISGDGMSGLPNARSMTSSPARRSCIFNASIWANAYGGSALIRRNSTKGRLAVGAWSPTRFRAPLALGDCEAMRQTKVVVQVAERRIGSTHGRAELGEEQRHPHCRRRLRQFRRDGICVGRHGCELCPSDLGVSLGLGSAKLRRRQSRRGPRGTRC